MAAYCNCCGRGKVRVAAPSPIAASIGRLVGLGISAVLLVTLVVLSTRFSRTSTTPLVRDATHKQDAGLATVLESGLNISQYNLDIIGKAFAQGEQHEKMSKKPNSAFLFLVSKSAPKNMARRGLARSGWVSTAMQNSQCKCDTSRCSSTNRVCTQRQLTWTHRFLAGAQDSNKQIRAALNSEVAYHRDVILYPEVDAYTRLTFKTVWLLRFLNRNIRAEYFLLLDDDCYVQIWRVALYLHGAPHHGLYSGHVEPIPPRVSRSSWRQFQISREAIATDRYPKYAWGAGYFMSEDVVETAVKAVDTWTRPWFMVDDAFLGVLLNASGIRVRHIPEIYTAGLYRRMGCYGDWADDVTQPIVIAGDLKDTKYLIWARSRNQSLCSLLAGYQQPFARLYWYVTSSNSAMAAAIFVITPVIVWLVLAIRTCTVNALYPKIQQKY